MRQRMLFRMLLGAQFLIFLFMLGAAGYFLWLSFSQAVLAEADSPEAQQGLKMGLHITAGLFGGTCLVWGASFFGLLRRQPWGWWLGLIANFFVFAITAWDLISERGSSDPEDYLIPAVFLVITILQVLTRPTTWRLMEREPTSLPESQHSAGSGI